MIPTVEEMSAWIARYNAQFRRLQRVTLDDATICVGDRIRFTRTIAEPRPNKGEGVTYANKGDLGTVVNEFNDGTQFIVFADRNPIGAFGVDRQEIEPLLANPPASDARNCL